MLNIPQLGRMRMGPMNIFSSIRQLSLGHLKPMEGAVKSYKRLGRGPASKGGKSGRGQKGQKARGSVPRLFEGGQTPMWKKLPIIGFKRPHARVYNEIKLEKIQDFWNNGRIPLKEGDTLSIEKMKRYGIVSGTIKDGVKILSNGKENFKVPLNIEASKASIPAIRTINKNGFKYTSVYHSKLGLTAHINPNRFYLKKGYLPLQARPTHKRDIKYYSNPLKKGYLLEDRSILLDRLENYQVKREVPKSSLDLQLEQASTKKFNDYHQTKVINMSDL